MPLSENIRKFRELRGLSVQQLADKMNIGKAGIYKWENGENKPGQESLTELAKALDVSIGQLLDENHTSVEEQSDNKELKAAIYEKFVDDNSPYRMVPKTILEGQYRIVLESELKERSEMWREALAAKNDVIEQLKKEIAFLRSGSTVKAQKA